MAASALLREILRRYGLESLFRWADEQVKNNVPEEQLLVEMRKTPEYLRRFPGMQARINAGLRAPSEEEYIQVEEGYRRILRSFGLPAHMFDDPNDFLNAFKQDISVEELGERAEIWELVQRAPNVAATVKGQFRKLLGVEDFTDEQLTRVLLGYEDATLAGVRRSFIDGGGQELSVGEMRLAVQEALRDEAARFAGSPTMATTREGIVALTGIEEEVY